MGKYAELGLLYSEYQWVANNVGRWWTLKDKEAIKDPPIRESADFKAAESLKDLYDAPEVEFKAPEYCCKLYYTRPQLLFVKKLCKEQRWKVNHQIIPEYYRRIDKKPDSQEKYIPYIQQAERTAALLKQVCNKVDKLI